LIEVSYDTNEDKGFDFNRAFACITKCINAGIDLLPNSNDKYNFINSLVDARAFLRLIEKKELEKKELEKE